MKKQGINLTMVLLLLIAGWTTSHAQNQIDVPGDNFSLEGALELFKKSGTPEEFEKMLNDPETKVNNLDLNGDGYIDYIRVIDKNKKNVHVFIMQAVISESQAQDVAVITLEKRANGKAVLQITGDEDVYGVETIIEPTAEVRTYGGTQTARVTVNVWAWPSVQYIYGSSYSAWVSPWGWGYQPVWWSPWRPMPYYSYYPYWRPYYAYYSPCYVQRIVYAEQLYRPYRTTSVIVVNRNREQIQHYRSNHVNNGRSADNTRNSSSVSQRSTSARYDANGRLSTSNNARVSSRSSDGRIQSDNGRTAVRSENSSNARSGSDLRTNSGSSNTQRSSSIRSNVSSENSNSGARQSGVTSEKSRVPVSVDRSRSSEGSNTQGYQRSSSNSNRTYGSSSGSRQSAPSVERQSSGNSNARKSNGSYSSQRSSSGSSAVQRSSGSSSSQGSSGYSSPSRSSSSSSTPSSSGRSSSGSSQRSSDSTSQRGGSR